MLQRQLNRTGLSVGGATFSRFMFSFPIIALATIAAGLVFGHAIPSTPAPFWAYALPGGIAQILATACVIRMFSLRNFAVGIAFKKSEAVLTAFVGILILGEYVTPAAWIAIALGVVAVLILSQKGEAAFSWAALRSPATVFGLTSGLFFAFSSVLYRGATLSLEGPVLLRSAVTLACVTAWQSLALGLWLWLREPGELARVFRAWRVAALVGITSLIGSYCWFTAFALQNAAYVKALGQVEVLFSIAATALLLGERITARELWGIAVLTVSILFLVQVV
nr:DMT family transporter [Palleronia pontilimi]